LRQCDPDWIQTNDPKLRRFVLYSAELPGRNSFQSRTVPTGRHGVLRRGGALEMAAKIKKNGQGAKPFCGSGF
jgi:hypothetical protein